MQRWQFAVQRQIDPPPPVSKVDTQGSVSFNSDPNLLMQELDREMQRTKTYTGIPTIPLQDQAITESMGPIYDRTQEHLGSTDAMVIQVRHRLLDAAHALREEGITPLGVDHPDKYRVRTASVVLDRGADWQAATQEVLKAFSGLPVANA